jgi:response regulator RpfG family c-di-GMP phosphodiesterase
MKNKILKAVIIDDEEINLLLFEGYIKDLGMDVISFDNSKDGLEYLKQNGADLVYVDYMMPEMDGVELIKEFRKIHKTTPVLMITSTSDDEALMLQALDAGATEFLLKPIKPFEFKIRSKSLMTLRKSQNELRERVEFLENQLKK